MNTSIGILAVILLFLTITTRTYADDDLQDLGRDAKPNNHLKSLNLLSNLRSQIQEKETELENAEKINKNFERMIQLVNIMGQVDTFLTDRTKLMLKKLALLADDLDGNGGGHRKSGSSYDIKF